MPTTGPKEPGILSNPSSINSPQLLSPLLGPPRYVSIYSKSHPLSFSTLLLQLSFKHGHSPFHQLIQQHINMPQCDLASKQDDPHRVPFLCLPHPGLKLTGASYGSTVPSLTPLVPVPAHSSWRLFNSLGTAAVTSVLEKRKQNPRAVWASCAEPNISKHFTLNPWPFLPGSAQPSDLTPHHCKLDCPPRLVSIP